MSREQAKDAAIAAVRRASDLLWESGKKATEAKHMADTTRIQQQLQYFL